MKNLNLLEMILQLNTSNLYLNETNNLGQPYFQRVIPSLLIYSVKCFTSAPWNDLTSNSVLLTHILKDYTTRRQNQYARNLSIGLGTTLNQQKKFSKTWFTMKVWNFILRKQPPHFNLKRKKLLLLLKLFKSLCQELNITPYSIPCLKIIALFKRREWGEGDLSLEMMIRRWQFRQIFIFSFSWFMSNRLDRLVKGQFSAQRRREKTRVLFV